MPPHAPQSAPLYAQDKAAARDGRWRVPESTLHASALAGGWPGALIAQQLLRSPAALPLVDSLQDAVRSAVGGLG